MHKVSSYEVYPFVVYECQTLSRISENHFLQSKVRGRVLTQTHNNRITKSLWMFHVFPRHGQEISAHLHSLRINQFGVLVYYHALHEVLVDNSSICSPRIAVIHYEDMITTSDETIAYVRWRPIAVDV